MFDWRLFPTSDPAEAPVLRQPQLPAHGGQSDRGRVQPDAHRRAHPYRAVQVHRVWPRPHGEDCCGQTQFQVQSGHCLNLSALVPPDHTFTLHRQVRLGRLCVTFCQTYWLLVYALMYLQVWDKLSFFCTYLNLNIRWSTDCLFVPAARVNVGQQSTISRLQCQTEVHR